MESSINRFLEAVEQAQRGRPIGDGYDNTVTVGEALNAVESAHRAWLALSDQMSLTLGSLDEADPTISAQTNAARCVLSELNIGVAGAEALLQPLAGIEDPDEVLIENVDGWLNREFPPSALRLAAFGPPDQPERGLISLLRTGPADSDAKVNHDHPVVHAVDTICDNTAETMLKVMAELAAGPVLGALIPTTPGIADPLADRLEMVRKVLEAPTAWAIEKAVDVVPNRVARWAQEAMRRATALVVKVIGQHRFDQIRHLINEKTEGATARIARRLNYVYGTEDVVQRGMAAYDPRSKPVRYARRVRLWQLERSNETWLTPVNSLCHTLGPLWAIPMPCPPFFPLAPVAAAILIAWALLLGGDQLDSRYYPFMIFWHGVVDRASGQ